MSAAREPVTAGTGDERSIASRPDLTAPGAPSPGRPTRSSPRYRPALDGLRGLAALWVLAYHCWIRTGAGDLDGLGPLAPILRMGTLGVEVFFVLSGCVLALRLLETPVGAAVAWWPFVVRRLARLLPAVWVALGLAVVSASLHQASTDAMRRSLTPESILANGALLAGVGRLIPGYEGAVGFVVDPVVWSLTPELLFSLVLVPLMPLVRRSPAVVLGLLVLAGIALRAGDPSLRVLSVASPLLTGFPLGIAAALVLVRWPAARRFAAPLAGLGLLALLAVVETRATGSAGAMKDAFALNPLVSVVVSLACAALCVGLAASGSATGHQRSATVRPEVDALRRTLTDRLFASRALVALGRWSYGIYLWHFPLIGVLVWSAGLPADGTNRSVALAILLATPLSIVAGAASHRLIEQPARRWAGRRTAEPAMADETPVVSEPSRPTTP